MDVLTDVLSTLTKHLAGQGGFGVVYKAKDRQTTGAGHPPVSE